MRPTAEKLNKLTISVVTLTGCAERIMTRRRQCSETPFTLTELPGKATGIRIAAALNQVMDWGA